MAAFELLVESEAGEDNGVTCTAEKEGQGGYTKLKKSESSE